MQIKFNKLLVILIPTFYFSFLTLISLIVFQTGIYSDEIDIIGYDNGSLLYYIFYLIISFITFFFIWKLTPSKIKRTSYILKNRKEVIVISSLLLIFYAIPIFIHGPSFLLGINRYEYQLLFLVKFFNIKLFLAIFSFIWGAYVTREKKFFSPFIILYLIYIIICILYGEKGSGIIDSIFFFITGYLLYKVKKIKVKKIFIIMSIILAIPIILFSAQLYLVNIPVDLLFEAFLIRLGRQSQVFWGAYDIAMLKSSTDSVIWQGFNYYYEGLKGMKLIMYNLMPLDKYESHTGSLAAGYPGILFFITNSNFILIILYIVFSIIYIIPFIFYFLFLFRLPYFYLIAPFFVFAITVHLKIFQTGNIFLISNPKYILFYTFILFFILVSFINFRKKI